MSGQKEFQRSEMRKHSGTYRRKLHCMHSKLPRAVPEIPVSNIDNAVEYYVHALGFHLDWGDENGGIAGISQGDCRIFLTNSAFRQSYRHREPVNVWLNLSSREEVNELFTRWRQAGAKIVSEPEDKPWNLREFRVADDDGNQLRVFYDFAWELRREQK